MVKKATSNLLAIISTGLCFLFSVPAYQVSAQTLQFWDNNGAGTPTGGIFDTNTANWAMDGNLTASPVVFTNGNFPIFTAGSTSAGTITVMNDTPDIAIAGLDNNGVAGSSCTLTVSGAGSFYLVPGTDQMYISSGASTTINVPIDGPGGIIQNGSGSLYLLGNNTYSGGTTITGGQILYYNNNNSFGMGPFTNVGTQSLLLFGSPGIVTLPNAFVMNNNGGIMNFGSGNTTCTGPWTLMTSPQLKNNGGSSTVVTISGQISGPFGIYYQCPNAGKIVLSGPNTYTGLSFIGYSTGTAPQTVSVSSINSVANPPQQSSSSLGVPSSVANGTIPIGFSTSGAALIYTGAGETSDRVISLTGTTGGATIQMDGTGPLVLTSSFTAPTNGAKTLTLQGTSTATNTIAGAIPNSTSATSLTKAQAGNWVLTGTNTFTGATTISGGTLTIGGSGKLNNGAYAGAIANAGTFIYNSSAAQTLSGVISGAGTLTEAGSGAVILSGANTYTGVTTISGGTLQANHSESVGTSGSFGKSADVNPGSIILSGGTLQYSTANNNHDFSGRFSTAANQAYNIDVNSRAVTYALAGLSSSGGELTLSSTTAGGTLTLNATASYDGPTTINSGSLVIGSLGSLGSGNYAANITDNGAFTYTGSGAQVLSGTFTGTGSLTQNGAGSLTLSGSTVIYTGATTIGAGSALYLTASAATNYTSRLSIAAGGTLDVSAISSATYTITNSTSLTATGSSTAAATINGAPAEIIDLGSQPMSLTISPTNYTGANQPALVIPQSLALSGNVITVNNASGIPLGAGNYVLISVGSGTTTGTPSQYVTVTGAGLVAGDFATVQVSGGNVVLSVQQPANASPTWNGNDYATFHTWSDSANWVSGAPDAIGDSIYFANGSSQTPVMDSSYSVYSLTFLGGTASDVLTNSGGSVLTVGSGVTNSSGNPQTIALPVQLLDLGGPLVASQWDTTGGNITASGVIADNNIGLALSGGNTLALTGANTYTGGTTVNGSTLSVNTIADANCSIGPSGSLTLSNGASLVFTGTSGTTTRTITTGLGSATDTINISSNNSVTLNGQVHNGSDSAPQMLTLTGGGTLNLGGSLDNSGLTMAVNQGTLVITKTSAATVHGLGSGTTTVGTGSGGNSAELQLAGSGNSDLYSGCLITVNSPDGFVDLNGQSDSFSTLTLAGAGPSGNGALINSATATTSSITNGGGAVVLAGNTTIGGSGNIRLASAVSGSGMALTYNGTGTLTLATAGTYSGGTTVNAGGTLQLTAGSTTGSSAGTGTITLNGNAALNLNLTNTQMNNVITGGANNLITINMGSGNLWLSNSPAGQLDNFSGTISVNSTSPTGGQLVVGTAILTETINSSAIWQIHSGAVVDFNVGQTDPATVYLYGLPYTGATLGSLRLDYSVQSGPVILMGNSQIGNGSAVGPSTITGIISDAGNGYGFTKMGANSIVLSATNTYTGPTTNNAGSLVIDAAGSIASSNVTINAGTFEMDNATALASNATLNVAASGATVNLNYGGSQTIGALFVGGVQQAPGTYGAGATNPNGIFTGSGTLIVGTLLPITISSAIISADQLTISWSSVSGGSYNVYSTTNLAPPITWTLVNGSPISGAGTNTSYTLPGSVSGQPQLFIKIMQ